MKKFFFIVAAFALAIPAWAFRFYPIVMEFAPSGEGASRAFYAENTSAESIAVQVSVMTRTMDMDGTEFNDNANEAFLVYPAQMVLGAGRRQAIRIQWLGTPNPARELAFRVIAEQLPVDFGSEGSEGGKINILFRYVGSVYITPPDAMPDVRVVSASIVADGDRPVLSIVLSNDGTAHTLLADLEVTVTDKDGAPLFTLTDEVLKGMAGENILAKSRRRFIIELSDDVAATGSVHAELTFTPTK